MDFEILLEAIEDIETALLTLAEEVLGRETLDVAWRRLDAGSEGVVDFSEYLIYDYKQPAGDTFLSVVSDRCEELALDPNILTIMANSVISAYEVNRIGGKVYYKDVFTKVDYAVDPQVAGETGMLYIGRLYRVGECFIPKNSGRYVAISHRESLVKGIINRLRMYEESNERVSPEVFVKDNPEFFYWYLQALDQVDVETDPDDEVVYQVHVAYYGFEDRVVVKYALNGCADLVMEEDDGAVSVYSHRNSEGMVISEWVLTRNMLEVNANTQESRAEGKRILEEALTGLVTHLSDKVETLDGLL